ncbi:MAG: PIN domain protein [Bacteroidetes bacterium]|nr:PIN domain protein [Bacteroidota bacterium]
MKRKQKIYIDTSVAGGYFDKEFSDDTRKFFARIKKGELIIILSSLLDNELLDAPERVRSLIHRMKKNHIGRVKHTEEAEVLAEKYLIAKVVGKTSIEDCRHIALATICNADVLVSWNFKHIVNVERINGYNSVNLKNGYKTLDIRTPKEALHYE